MVINMENGRVTAYQHESNVSLIYNPATMHVTLQLYLVYDECFMSLLPLPIQENQHTMECLLLKASWMHPE
jgi:hypothetical protein